MHHLRRAIVFTAASRAPRTAESAPQIAMLAVGRGPPRLDPLGLRPTFSTGHQGVHRRPVELLTDNVGVAGMPGEFLDQMEKNPSRLVSLGMVGEPRCGRQPYANLEALQAFDR